MDAMPSADRVSEDGRNMLWTTGLSMLRRETSTSLSFRTSCRSRFWTMPRVLELISHPRDQQVSGPDHGEWVELEARGGARQSS